ncbi:MAG: hypothetical protein BWY45_03339 [Euryarchaeota archaeon ADurb.Bin294]|nr:MAG: hypothetical protein BWY45_03339 [Euryarchaeota archaeon ADurb.Bin294]
MRVFQEVIEDMIIFGLENSDTYGILLKRIIKNLVLIGLIKPETHVSSVSDCTVCNNTVTYLVHPDACIHPLNYHVFDGNIPDCGSCIDINP